MERKKRGIKQIKAEIADPHEKEFKLPNNQPWTASENQQLIKLISNQFDGSQYKAYRDGIEDIDWNMVDIEQRSTDVCKVRLTEMVSKIKKYRTINEILMDYANTHVHPLLNTQRAAETETIENVGKKIRRENEIHQTQEAAPAEVETTENVIKKTRRENQIHQTQGAAPAEVETTEKVVKKTKRDNQIHLIQGLVQAEVETNVVKKRKQDIQTNMEQRAAETENFSKKIKREHQVHHIPSAAQVETVESFGKKRKPEIQVHQTPRAALVEPTVNVVKKVKSQSRGKSVKRRDLGEFVVTDDC